MTTREITEITIIYTKAEAKEAAEKVNKLRKEGFYTESVGPTEDKQFYKLKRTSVL